MDKLTQLGELRRHYSELLKIFFQEVQNGRQLHEITRLQQQIDSVRSELRELERELNVQAKQ